MLREQGVNSHVELSYAMDRAGFDTYDVHMTDLQAGRARLDMFSGFVACGGFSYGDTLGAGEGWARSVLFNPKLADQFASFFARPDVFALGICNGCQMLAALAAMIPGADAWPRFTRNKSEQFEARLSLVEVLPTPSIFFSGLAGSRIPIAVAHGEGYADFSQRGDPARVLAALRFVDHHGRPTEAYPANPNGSPGRPHGGDHGRRPLHRADAASGAGLPQRPDELDLGRAQRREPVAEDLRERPPRARLTAAALRPPRSRASAAASRSRSASGSHSRTSAGCVIGPMWPTPGSVTLAQRGSTEASKALIARTGAGEVSPPSSSTGISSARQASSGNGSAKAARNSAPTLVICGASRSRRPASIAAQVPAPDQ